MRNKDSGREGEEPCSVGVWARAVSQVGSSAIHFKLYCAVRLAGRGTCILFATNLANEATQRPSSSSQGCRWTDKDWPDESCRGAFLQFPRFIARVVWSSSLEHCGFGPKYSFPYSKTLPSCWKTSAGPPQLCSP